MGLFGKKSRGAQVQAAQGAPFAADFARVSDRLSEAAPTSRRATRDWAEAELGSEAPDGGAGLAVEWYIASLDDRRPGAKVQPRASARVGCINYAGLNNFLEDGPEAKKVLVGLGEALWAEGALAGPYDERSITDDPYEPLGGGEPGPTRLNGLITLCAFAHEVGHPIAAEWTAAARAGIPTVPPSVFPKRVRTLWADLGEGDLG